MTEQQSRVDRILGYGGFALVTVVIAVMIATIQSSESGGSDWLEIAGGVLGVTTLVWMIAITVRHFRSYGERGGRGLVTASWVSIPVISGLVVILGGFSSGDNRLGEWLFELLGSPRPYMMLLAVPLLMASVAILIDVIDEGRHDQGKVQGTLGWHQRPAR